MTNLSAETSTEQSKKLAALSSLALLKEDMDSQSRDYIDYLRAFVEHVISKHSVDPINVDTVAAALSREFGLNLPDRVLELVLHRLLRAKSLVRQGGLYTAVRGSMPRHEDFDLRRQSLNSSVEEILGALQAYLARAGSPLSRGDGLNALLRFLSRFAIDYLRAYLLKSTLPDVKAGASRTDVQLAQFIRDCYESSPALFAHIVSLVKGQMYANALLCPDLEGLKKDFKIVRFFLDTPLALHLLGFHGDHRKKSATELVELLRSLNARVSIFSHTLQELSFVVRSSADWVNRPNGRGLIVQSARLNGWSRTDLMVRADRVETELTALGVSVHLNPPLDSEFQISELAFQDALEERIEYSNELAMRADVESVRAIYCLRGKTVPNRIEDTLAVVVSTNRAYARAAYIFGKSHNSSREVSPVISDFAVANIAWLKSPMKWTNLPEVETLSACFAALEPSAADWRMYFAKLEQLEKRGTVDPDEHALLRVSPVTRIDVLDLVADAEDQALQGGTVRDIVDRIKQGLLKEKEAEISSLRSQLEEASRIARGGSSVSSEPADQGDHYARLSAKLDDLSARFVAMTAQRENLLGRSGHKVFIGHGRSKAWKDLKDFLVERLGLSYDEFNRIPVAGITNTGRLSTMLDSSSCAFVIMTAEDEMADGESRARMNVIHEVGLFQGRLGFTRAIVLLEDTCAEFSNIQGLGQIRFPAGNIAAAFEEVRQVLEREGVISSAGAA